MFSRTKQIGFTYDTYLKKKKNEYANSDNWRIKWLPYTIFIMSVAENVE